MLFCVVTRGVESSRPLPLRSSAVRATSRLNAPLIEPSARPTALLAAGTPRLTDVGTLGFVDEPATGPCVPPTRPPRLPLFGNARPVVLPRPGSTRPLNPHCTPSARA